MSPDYGMSLSDLVEKARSGDNNAEDRLFQILRARFASIAKRRVREKETAEDIVQQACVTVLQKYKTEEFRAGFEAWAYCVLRMKIGNYIQAKSSSRESLDDGTVLDRLPEKSPSDPDLERKLIDCLRKIIKVYPRYARVLSLSYQGFISDEICNRLNVTKTNLYSLLSRGRSVLSLCLETGRV